MKFRLSPNTLSLFLECKRCFWFHVIKGKDFRRPEMPASTLPRGMDLLIKDYFDKYRNKGILPPDISDKIEGTPVSQDLIDVWRNPRVGISYIDPLHPEALLYGALDECIIVGDLYIPCDYKTRGFALKEDSASFYVFQLSCYNFLLEKNGYPVSDYGYLFFYIPRVVEEEGNVKFDIEVQKISLKPSDYVYNVFRSALEVLSLNSPPEANPACSFCSWAERMSLF
jgi:hypothetical protein